MYRIDRAITAPTFLSHLLSLLRKTILFSHFCQQRCRQNAKSWGQGSAGLGSLLTIYGSIKETRQPLPALLQHHGFTSHAFLQCCSASSGADLTLFISNS